MTFEKSQIYRAEKLKRYLENICCYNLGKTIKQDLVIDRMRECIISGIDIARNNYVGNNESVKECLDIWCLDLLDLYNMIKSYDKEIEVPPLVYPEFDKNIHVIKPFKVPSDWQSVISIDLGYNNPLSAHWYAINDEGDIYVVAEHYKVGKDVSYHCEAIWDKSKELCWHQTKRGFLRAVTNTSAKYKVVAGTKRVAELLEERKIHICDYKNGYNKNMADLIRKHLRGEGHKLYVFNTCVNMIDEFETYFFTNYDTAVKRNDHCMDDLINYFSFIYGDCEVVKE